MEKEIVEKKPYMGNISWAKCSSSSPRPLFGTDIETRSPIRLTISEAEQTRSLCRNRFFARKSIVEIELSPLQWAEFLTSGNTSGVPCTLRYVNGEKMPEVETAHTVEHFSNETKEQIEDFRNVLKPVMDALQEAVDSNKPMGIGAVKKLLAETKHRQSMANANLKFVKDSFEETMADVVARAKAEVNAFVETRAVELGIKEIKGNFGTLSLEQKEQDKKE